MAARTCATVLTGCPGVDTPITNSSAESPDPLLFAAVAYPVYRKYKPPLLGTDTEVEVDCDLIMQLIDSYSLGNPVFYADTQLYANLLALAAEWGCDWPPDDTTIGDPTIDPDTLLPNESTAVYSNEAQTATARCPSGALFTYTVPAGVKQSPPIIASLGAQYVEWANAWALAYAQLQVSLLLGANCIYPDDVGPPVIIIPGNGPVNPPGQTPPPNIPSGPGILVYPGWMCFGNEYFQRYRIPGTFNSAYTIDISAGALAPGLTFQQVGPREATITGIPTAPGEYTWTIRAVGTFMPQFTLTAQDSLWVFGISNADTLPDAEVAVDYGPEQLNATGGTAPYTFSSSNLPTGFSLSPSGALTGDGDTMVAGDYTFDVTIVDDKGGECEQECSITVLSECSGTASSIGDMVWVVTGSPPSDPLGHWSGSMSGGSGVGMVQVDYPGFDNTELQGMFYTSHFCNPTGAPVTLTFSIAYVSSGSMIGGPGHVYNFGTSAWLDGVQVDIDSGSMLTDLPNPLVVSLQVAAHSTSEVALYMAIQCAPGPPDNYTRVNATITIT